MTSVEHRDAAPLSAAEQRVALGRALQRRAPEVAAAVLADFTSRDNDIGVPLATFAHMVTRTCSMATDLIGRYLATGEGATAEEAYFLAERSTAYVVEYCAMTDVVKNYLRWRDETVKVVREESARLGVDPALVREARYIVAFSADVSMVRMVKEFDQQRRDLQARLDHERARFEHLALHDPLTGLANRTLLLDRLRHAIAGAGRRAAPTGVLYLDLDGFKAINDECGHETGDRLLVAVGSRLLQAVRPTDTVARLGGDEFVVLCADVSGEDGLLALTTRLAATFDAPFDEVAGLRVRASIGGTLAEADERAEQVLARADEKMYTAKRRARCPQPAVTASSA